MPIPLGPFQLLHPIGRGGMGVVWLGHHQEQGVAVAVKVITSRIAASPEYQRAFLKEVRAVSSLDHQGIVWLFDYGSIPKASAVASDHQLVEGSPYLVMEYAGRGSLRQLGRTLKWHEVRGVLLALLDALAHAHARGVIHRDLKPDNVLIAGANDLRPGFKLTDFGIAHPLDETASAYTEDRPVGTPHYMAPEQIRGEAKLYGPHTDLYALGCMAYRLVSGRLPFQGMKGASLMYAQMSKAPPELQPIVALPEGFDEWLRVMMQKEPGDRYRCAADAALALASLGPPEMDESSPGERLPGLEQFASWDQEQGDTTLKMITRNTRLNMEPLDAVQPSLRPSLPRTWRLPPNSVRPLRLMGAGLGLYGLRPVPFVGRAEERDALWGALAAARKDNSARAVVVRGAAGAGKSRLVQWVSERAAEVGGATVVRASFSATGASHEPIRKSVVRHLQGHPVGSALAEALAPTIARWSVEASNLPAALDQLLDPTRYELSPAAWRGLVRRTFEGIAADRPLMVVFDDVQWGLSAVKLAQHVLDMQRVRPAPIVMVLTVLEDVLDADSEIARRLAGLEHRKSAERLDVGPLVEAEHKKLVQALLGLDKHLAAAVEERTDGNPLFAVQLIGDWVERGVLMAGPTGFRTRNPNSRLPANLEEVWDGRICALVEGQGKDAGWVLERAAVLGREVDVLEWQRVCDDPSGAEAALGRVYFSPRKARLRKTLMDRLFANRLGQNTEAGFVFTHAAFRAALIDKAKKEGREQDHNLACAQALIYDADPMHAERIGLHLLAAGRPGEAVEFLLEGVRARQRSRGAAAALKLLEEARSAMQAAKIPAADPLWGFLWLLRANSRLAEGNPESARRWALRVAEAASDSDWPTELSAGAAASLGMSSRALGDRDGCEQHFLIAVKMLGTDGDPAVAMRCWHNLRELAVAKGDRALAKARGEEVRRWVELARTEAGKAFGYAALAGYALADGDHLQAQSAAEKSLGLSQAIGDLEGLGRALAVLAEVASAAGLEEQARDYLQLCAEVYEEPGDSAAVLVRCKLSMLESRRGEYHAARAALEPILAETDLTDPDQRAAVAACMLLWAAGAREWAVFDEQLRLCGELFAQIRSRHVEYPRAVEEAGKLALKRRQQKRAALAWQLAIGRYKAVGHPDEARALKDELKALAASAKRS